MNILLVGEGNLSFALALVTLFGGKDPGVSSSDLGFRV
jgi:hypothetical protein